MQIKGQADEIRYRFTRVKDVHMEKGEQYITLFGRLAIERNSGIQTAWVEIEEVALAGASSKLKAMPNALYTFYVPKNVFLALYSVSKATHQELYYLTPIHYRKELQRMEWTL